MPVEALFDISEPGAFDLFVNGELKGRLDAQQNPLDKVAAD